MVCLTENGRFRFLQVDFAAAVDEDLLEGLQLSKGNRRLISHEERGAVLGRLDGESYKCNAGGETLSSSLLVK